MDCGLQIGGLVTLSVVVEDTQVDVWSGGVWKMRKGQEQNPQTVTFETFLLYHFFSTLACFWTHSGLSIHHAALPTVDTVETERKTSLMSDS